MLLRPETREPPVYAVGGITLAQWRLILLGRRPRRRHRDPVRR